MNPGNAVTLEFLPNPGEEEEGLGHAGIETYRQSPYAGVARETGQNSRDAFAALPVRISYDLVEISTEQVPNLDELRWVIDRCLSDATGLRKEKEIGFFKNAKAALSKPTIPILRIADFNTQGARGPSVSGTPFYSLTKGSGVSVKGSAASGGSFGIGKNAAFAVSDLQAVFYSTVYDSGNGHEFLAQGKVILASHVGRDETARRQVGYWGRPDFKPIDKDADAPSWVRRSEVGTSVHIIGFREPSHWKERFALSLLQNFFPAIHRGEMEFSIDSGRMSITKNSLASQFADPQLRDVAKADNREVDLDLAAALYKCLTSPEAVDKTFTLPELGSVSVRVLVAEGLQKKVVLTRNGMVITDSLEHFGDKFARFPMYRDFVALVTPLDDSGSAYIKKLEDPKHSALSAEGLPNVVDRERAKVVMKRLAERIREAVKASALAQFDTQVAIEELRQFFAAEAEKKYDKEGKQHDPEKIVYALTPRKRRPSAGYQLGDSDEGGGTGDGGEGPGPRQEGNGGDDSGVSHHGNGNRSSSRRIRLLGIRNVLKRGTSRVRTLFFTPDQGGEADIAVFATGLDGPEQIDITAASRGSVDRGRVRCSLAKSERVSIDIELAEDYAGPIDLRVFFAEDASA